MSEAMMMNKAKGHVCPHQAGFMLDNPFRRLIQSPKKIVGEYIRPGDTVIDVGCGPGYFTIDMAKMVGHTGRVVAADLQQPMLLKVKKKAARHGVSDRIQYHQCEADKIGLKASADFILAYYMIHETPDPKRFLAELNGMLKAGGKLLIVEPKMHVSKKSFENMLAKAERAGLKILDTPKGKGGRSVLLTPASDAS
jgi:ubiquinone/menaquinone biosynthesis C-methylase UbiE